MECCNKEKSKKELRDLVDFLKAISEENRLKILCIIQKESLCVCEIWRLLELPQNLVSHHLKILKDFGLVDTRKKGTKVFYSINNTNSKKYIALLSRYI
jgi:ArsR family transcriptional regulator, arsenate/arsenite/antimonite-responsive transcriptional repressor